MMQNAKTINAQCGQTTLNTVSLIIPHCADNADIRIYGTVLMSSHLLDKLARLLSS